MMAEGEMGEMRDDTEAEKKRHGKAEWNSQKEEAMTTTMRTSQRAPLPPLSLSRSPLTTLL